MAMNLVKLQNDLRSVPDSALVNYVKNPQPHVPAYLALSELQRRESMRSKYQQQQAEQPESSVAEDLVQRDQDDMAGLAAMDTGNAIPQEYAGGGMVAFAKGGPSYDYSLPMEDTENAPQKYMSKYESLLGQNQGLIDIQNRLAKQEERAQKQMELAPGMALIRAGLKTMAGTSQFALQNFGEGGVEGLTDYAAAQDRFEKANDRYLDARSRLAQAERAERAAMVSGALSAEEKAAARNATRQAQELEARAGMDKQLVASQAAIKAAQIAAAKKSDYETSIYYAQKNPEYYKVVKGKDGKPVEVFDIQKANEDYKAYTVGRSSASSMLDDDTLGRIWQEKSMLPSFVRQYPTPADFIRANRAVLSSPNTTQSDTWSNLQVTNPKR